MTTGAQFKKTDIGLIPVDWTKLNLGKSASLKARIGWQGLTTAEYLDSGDYSLITGTDFKNGYIDWDNCVFVKKNRFDQDRNIQIKLNDVLVTKDGTIGKVALINKIKKPATLNSGVFVIRPISNSFNPKYFYYVLRSNHFKDFLEKLSAGSTINHLYQKDFVYYSFPLPPLPEQEAIAEVLSDTDALIGALEKRIAKKRLIKQGAMQKLLTPKDGWEVSSFSELFDISAGGDIDKENYNSYKTDRYQYPIYSNSLENQGLYGYSNQFKNKPNCITITGRGSIGYAENRITPFTAIIRLLVLSPKKNLSTYFFTAMINEKVDFKLESTGVPQLTAPQISNYRIPYPPYKEQETISEVLSDMDNEINALEKKLSKTKELKQGLMQQLLTGKIRLV